MSDKKKSKSSDKDKKTSKKSSKESSKPSPPAPAATPSKDASVDFEAGLLFSKYDKENTGVVTADDFRKLMTEYTALKSAHAHTPPATATATPPPAGASEGAPASTPSAAAAGQPGNFSFEAGKIFAQFDRGDGRIDKEAFETMLLSHPGLMNSASTAQKPTVPPGCSSLDGPPRSLTHFDETAGVAIPASSVTAHQAMGNSVVPLVESYTSRYTRLRTMLTAKLLPKREHLLQLRRQLQVASMEVEAVKKGIENETLSDTQQILDRLKHVESLRQSAIKHQILQLEKELQAIDRVVQRVESANNVSPFNGASNFSGLTILGSSPSAPAVQTASGNTVSNMVEIIQQYGELSATLDRLSTKQISVQTDFHTDDFPKETAERLEVISKCDKYMHAIAVKDQMLWVAMQEKKKAEDSLEQERKLSQEYAQEIAQWAEMSQLMASQIRSEKSAKLELEQRVEELTSILHDNRIFVDVKSTPYDPSEY